MSALPRSLPNCEPRPCTPGDRPAVLLLAQVRHLELTCLFLCRESRRQVARKVRVKEETPRSLWASLHRKLDGDHSTNSGRNSGEAVTLRSVPTAAVAASLGNFFKDKTGLLLRPPDADGSPLLGEGGAVAEGGGGGTRKGKQRKAASSYNTNDSRVIEVDSLSALCDYESGDSDDSQQGGSEATGRENIDGSVGNMASRRGREVACSEGGITAVIGDVDGSISGPAESSISSISPLAESDLPWLTANLCNSPIETSSATRITGGGGGGGGNSASKRRALLNQNIPKGDIGPSTVSRSSCGSRSLSRVPMVRVGGINWCLPRAELLKPGFQWPERVKSLTFWALFDESLEGIAFPDGLEELTFGFRFKESLDRGRISWPKGLKKLTFGARWNRHLLSARETWPASLEVLRFGTAFDRPLAGKVSVGGSTGGKETISLPCGLRELHLGGVFNQSLAGVEWPVGLQKLVFSDKFNCPLRGDVGDGIEGSGNCAGAGLRWPERLREISFGPAFNQDISQAQWPDSLEVLRFGKSFNWPLHGREVGGPVGAGVGGRAAALEYGRNNKSYLPPGLKELELGNDFSGHLSVMHLPRGLESLQCGPQYHLPSSIPTSEWPPGLTRLVGLRGFSYIGFPPSLEILRMDHAFDSSLHGATFPARLRVLDLGENFSHPLVNDAALPDGLEELCLGEAFKGDIETVDWRLPRGLKRLIFSERSGFNKAVSSLSP